MHGATWPDQLAHKLLLHHDILTDMAWYGLGRGNLLNLLAFKILLPFKIAAAAARRLHRKIGGELPNLSVSIPDLHLVPHKHTEPVLRRESWDLISVEKDDLAACALPELLVRTPARADDPAAVALVERQVMAQDAGEGHGFRHVSAASADLGLGPAVARDEEAGGNRPVRDVAARSWWGLRMVTLDSG